MSLITPLTLRSSAEDDTYATLTKTRVKFYITPCNGRTGIAAWKAVEKLFREEYDISVPTKDDPLFLIPHDRYDHLLITISILLGELRKEYLSRNIFFIRHQHGF